MKKRHELAPDRVLVWYTWNSSGLVFSWGAELENELEE